MRNRAQTIRALRALAERPGTPQEGIAARRMLEKMLDKKTAPAIFDPLKFPKGSTVFYCCWAYGKNARGVVRTKPPKIIRGEWWMLIKFDSLKAPRWVPVATGLGVHISTTPFTDEEAERLIYGWVL